MGKGVRIVALSETKGNGVRVVSISESKGNGAKITGIPLAYGFTGLSNQASNSPDNNNGSTSGDNSMPDNNQAYDYLINPFNGEKHSIGEALQKDGKLMFSLRAVVAALAVNENDKMAETVEGTHVEFAVNRTDGEKEGNSYSVDTVNREGFFADKSVENETGYTLMSHSGYVGFEVYKHDDTTYVDLEEIAKIIGLDRVERSKESIWSFIDSGFIISDVEYNDGDGPRLGAGNKVKFNLRKSTEGTGVYKVEIFNGWEKGILGLKGEYNSIDLNNIESVVLEYDNIAFDGSDNTNKLRTWVKVHGDDGLVAESNTIIVKMPFSKFRFNDGEGARLGDENKLLFTLDLPEESNWDYEYTIKLWMGWDDGEMYEKASKDMLLNIGKNNITFENIYISGIIGSINLKTKIIVSSRDITYYSSHEHIEIVMTELGVSKMRLVKESGGSFIFIHNPETFTDKDIISAYHGKNYLIYRQENIEGYNAVYITNSTKTTDYSDEEKPQAEFYYDLAFYNPSGQGKVTVNIKKPYDTIKYDWGEEDGQFKGLKHLLLDRLCDTNKDATDDIVIEEGEHKLLYGDILPQLFGVTNELAINPKLDENTWRWSFLGIFLDFTVEDGKNITLSSHAAYKKEHLTLSYDNEQLKAGQDHKVNIDGAPVHYFKRDCEDDLTAKPIGRDTSGIDAVKATLTYIVDDSLDDGNLYIINKDPFYEPETEEKQDHWVAHINPVSDLNTIKVSFPSALHTWEYTDKEGKWIFDFKNVRKGMEDSNYSHGIPGGGVLHSFKPEVIEYYKNEAHNQPTSSLPNNLTVDDIAAASIPYGGWGVRHKYIIDIQNRGSKNRTLKYTIFMSEYLAAVTYVIDKNTGKSIYVTEINRSDGKEEEWTSEFKGEAINSEDWDVLSGDGRPACKIFNIVIPARVHYEIHTTNMTGVGTAGLKNVLTLGTQDSNKIQATS